MFEIKQLMLFGSCAIRHGLSRRSAASVQQTSALNTSQYKKVRILEALKSRTDPLFKPWFSGLLFLPIF